MIKLMAVIKNKLQYGDTVIPYTVTQTKRKKTMQIFIEKDSVDVRAPESMELSKIKDVLKAKISWIFKQQLLLKERKPGIKITKKSFVYLGKPVPYSIKSSQCGPTRVADQIRPDHLIRRFNQVPQRPEPRLSA